MTRARRLSFAAIAVLLGTLAPLAVAEVALRIADRPRAVPIGWKPTSHASERNQFEFRGRPFSSDADVRIVLLGDSHVEATANSIDHLPEAHLERALEQRTRRRVSVVSIGSGGWGQDQQLLALTAHIDAIRPRLVVLWFTYANDIWNNIFPTHFPRNGWPKPTFWVAGTELRGPNVPWLALYRRREPYLVQAFRRAVRSPLYPTDEEWEAHLPPAYRPMAIDAATPSLAATLARHIGVSIGDLPYFSRENFDNEKTHLGIFLVPVSARLAYGVKLTRLLLQAIQQLCEANGAGFRIFMFEDWPARLPAEPTLFEVNGKGYMLSVASARHLVDELLRGLPTIRVHGPPPNSFVSATNRHLNAEGNRYVMEALAGRLQAEFK
jgi:hypothetical protein